MMYDRTELCVLQDYGSKTYPQDLSRFSDEELQLLLEYYDNNEIAREVYNRSQRMVNDE